MIARITKSLLLIGLFLWAVNSDAAPVKRVFFEEHTGAWCGWCVDGAHKLLQAEEQFPDNVIPIKLHNGDGMAIPLQQTIGSGMGLTGYPASSIDRKNFNGTLFPNRQGATAQINAWIPLVQSQINAGAKCDIQMVYSLDPVTRVLKATITAKMEETVNANLVFNLVIVEDGLTGAGNQWDQQNYLTNRAGYEFSPYYTQPSVIQGYVHDDVMRDMLGGAWGIPGEFTNPAVMGEEYSQFFTTTINPAWNIDNLQFIGVVLTNEPSSKEALNCCYGVMGVPKEPVIELSTVGSTADVVGLGNSFTKEFSLKNISTSDETYELMVSTSARTPSDWLGSVEVLSTTGKKNEHIQADEITLSAGATGTFNLKITPGVTLGMGDASVKVIPKSDPTAMKGLGSISAISQEIENFYMVGPTQTAYKIEAMLPQSENYFTMAPTDFNTFADKFTNLKTVVWDLGIGDKLDVATSHKLKTLFNNGANVFMCGDQLVSSLNTATDMTTWGLQFNYLSREGYGSSPFRVWLSGIEGDEISGDMGSNFEGNLKNLLLYMFKIGNSSIASPILRFQNDQVGYNGTTVVVSNIPKEQALLGAKIQEGDNKAVILGMSPFLIVNPTLREKLINNIFVWFGMETVSGPAITLSTKSINFNNTEVNKTATQMVTIDNTGTEDLDITNMTVEAKYTDLFEINPSSFVLEPNASQDIFVRFSPTKATSVNTKIIIESNAKTNPEISVSASAVSTDVKDGIINNGIFSLQANPNPFTAGSKLELTLMDNKSLKIQVMAVDVSGKVITEIADKEFNTGTSLLDFNINGLASGTYYIVAKANNLTAQIPVIITK